ncbi:hypothetical protein C2G38_2234783 [Gigaspora rosea]|uniref:Serine-threonine/tyrosine-protein kinase catalytic domain-containing protein n=1 Tax=Gigaspora rosea TaxID=44941 RepID=A0A397TYT7_9GLOM|nr:hypothetical protein C2G38_2234783 [Gigaspora rosea]
MQESEELHDRGEKTLQRVIPGTPDSYEDMINRCWDANPLKRPDASELSNFFSACGKRIRNGEDIFPELKLEKTIASSSNKTTNKFLASLSNHINATNSGLILNY